MEKRKYIISSKIYRGSVDIPLYSGEYYQFILIKSGSCSFVRLGETFRCGIDELLMLQPYSSLTLTSSASSFPLEIISFKLSKKILSEISQEDIDLLAYFSAMPWDCMAITAENSLMMITKNLIGDLIKQERSPELGDSVYRGGLLSLIVILFVRAFWQKEGGKREQKMKTALLDSLLSYIREHITEEIPLVRLEQEFNVSRRHIQREFKKGTGQTVHGYIVRAKLSLCKKYIAEGVAINYVYQLVGFGGYNHFFRAFKKEFQMTPKEYYRKFCEEPEKGRD